MTLYLVIGGLCCIAVLAWLISTPTADRPKIIKQLGLFGGTALLCLLALLGKMHWLFALVSALFVWISRALTALSLWQIFKSLRGRSGKPGQSSNVKTDFLHMSLDHESGELRGKVIKGKFMGRQLNELDLDELQELCEECEVSDPHSLNLLEAWIARFHGTSRKQREQPDNGNSTTISREEAASILGVDMNAPEEEIIKAHRRLIQRLHSDRGGNDYLASLLNRAKEIMLESASA